MRASAPCRTTDKTHIVIVHTPLASDPIRAQYRASRLVLPPVTSFEHAERVGPFVAWDPEEGAWPLSIAQRRILEEVVADAAPCWYRDVLLPFLGAPVDLADGLPSLRLIDWFVTNYSKSRGVAIKGCNIHADYVAVRAAYQCRNFDPFRRNLKLTLCLKDLTRHPTAVSQVNFLFWAHESCVLDYVLKHQTAIDRDMCTVYQETRKRRAQMLHGGQKRKRQPLSVSRIVMCCVTRDKNMIK